MARTSVVIGLVSASTSLAGFLVQLALAHAFGADSALDSYLLASSVPLTVSGVVAAMMSYSLLPELVRRKADPVAFRSFAGETVTLLAAAVLAAVLLGGLMAGPTISALGEPLPAAMHEQAVWMTRISWIWAGLLVISSFLGCILSALDRFYLPFVVSSLPYIGVLAFLHAFSTSLGILAVPLGMLAGAAASVLVLVSRAWEHVGLNALSGKISVELRRYLGSLPAVLCALSCFTTYALIDAYWAPVLGPGNLSYLGYAQRLLIAIGNVVIVGPAAILVSRMAAAGDIHGARARLLREIGATAVAAAGIAVIVSALASPVVALLFQRGSFDAVATQGVAGVLRVLLAGMVPMLCSVMAFRGLFQLGMVGTAALLGVSWNVLYVLLSGILSGLHGVEGIAFAYAASWWVTFLAALWAVVPAAERRGASREFLALGLACGISAAAAMAAVVGTGHLIGAGLTGVPQQDLLALMLQGFSGAVTYVVLYLLLTFAYKAIARTP